MSAILERSGTGTLAISTNLSNEINSLATETDPQLRREGCLRLAGRLESRYPALAAQIYADLAQEKTSDGLSDKAGERLAVLQGSGSFGARAERLFRQVGDQLFDPKILVPMMAGTMVFSSTRALLGARLAMGGGWGPGLAGRALASGLAFGAEVPTFVLLQRQMRSPSASLGEDLLHGGISLGLLKLSALAIAAPLRSLPNVGALHHAAGGLSLFAANFLEQSAGLRPKSDAGTALAESFLSYFTMSAGMELGRSLLGRGFQNWESRIQNFPSRPKPLPLDAALPQTMVLANAIYSPKARESEPVLMTGSGGSNRGGNRSIPPALAKKLSAEQRDRFMDPELEPPSRWEALEQFRLFHPQLAETKLFPKFQKELLRLVANPGIHLRTLKGKGIDEAVAYYGYQHRLRVTAADLYVQGLERASFAEPLVERGAQILRKVLEEPKIGRSYRPDLRNTEALDYYQKTEAATREKLFAFYTRLLFRLPQGSPEARKGIEMLSRAGWLHNITAQASVGRAYAYLLDAASPSQLAAVRETRGHLAQWLPYLETQARNGNREASLALLMAARHEKPAEMAVANLEQEQPQIAEYRVTLEKRDQRRAEDFKLLPERSDSGRLIDGVAYYLREWFWFWH